MPNAYGLSLATGSASPLKGTAQYKPEKNSYNLRDYMGPEKDMSIEERVRLARESDYTPIEFDPDRPLDELTPYYIRNEAAPHDLNEEKLKPYSKVTSTPDINAKLK